jgi:glutaredoxin
MIRGTALLYVLPECVHCDAKRTELRARGVVVREVDVRARPEVVPELLKLTGGRRVVPVVVEGTRIEVAPAGGSSF